MNKYRRLLSDFDFNKEEALIFEFVKNNNKTTILQISKMVSLPRTNVYRIVSKMMKKNLLYCKSYNKHKYIEAAPSTIFKSILKQKKSEVRQLKKTLPYVIEFLRNK